MKQLSISFKANIPNLDDCLIPTLECLIFTIQNKGTRIELKGDTETSHSLEDGVYSESFEGMSASVSGPDIEPHTFQELSDADFKLLMGAKLSVVEMGVGNLRFKHFLRADSLKVTILYGKKELIIEPDDFTLTTIEEHYKDQPDILVENNVTLDEIKEFAFSQLGTANPSVSVSDGEYEICDPWYSFTPVGRFLSDEEAVKVWGKPLVDKFIKRATLYLESR